MLLGALQENFITLLAFHAESAPVIRFTVDINLFGGPNRVIAVAIYDYIDKYRKPPGDHLADILSHKLSSENKAERELYTDLLHSIHAAQATVNVPYVMAQLKTFIRRQSLRSVAVDLAKALQRDTEESLEEAEQLIAGVRQVNMALFDPGLRLSDPKRALAFLDITNESFPTGIPELDRRGFGPNRKELWLFIGDTKAGKSWGLIHIAKMALVHHLRVCHITLEMSEQRCAQRYFQTLTSMAKRKDLLPTIHFERDELRRIKGFRKANIEPRFSLDDHNIRQKLEAYFKEASPRLLNNITIKQFPTGTLTVPQLTAYLDNLEATERFVPDLLVIDYPDLMKLDKSNYRLSIDETYKDIRGLAVARNVAVAIVSQSHRGAAKAKTVRADNVAEAYSKIAHCDVIITYTQTKHERPLGLARLHLAGGRNDADKFTIYITQQYGVGAFVLDSNLWPGNYWKILPKDEDETDEAE
jgi:replicative DNA helicase